MTPTPQMDPDGEKGAEPPQVIVQAPPGGQPHTQQLSAALTYIKLCCQFAVKLTKNVFTQIT